MDAATHTGRPSFSKDDALREMDTAGIDRAVIVLPSWEGPFLSASDKNG